MTGPAGEDHAAQVLTDLPVDLWPVLLRGVRRAVDGRAASELPPGLRPYARWKPERLAGDRPRRAIAQALSNDATLREAVGDVLPPTALQLGRTSDPLRLARTCGEAVAVAALAAHARWPELAVLAAEAGQRLQVQHRVAAAGRVDATAPEADRRVRRLQAELDAIREERDAARRRADVAEARLRAVGTEQDRLREELARRDVTAEAAAQQVERERQRSAQRVARLRRRMERAESRARTDVARVARVAAQLDGLAADLHGALDPPAPAAEPAPKAAGPAVPRQVVPARPGRPCLLPAGVAPDGVDAVRALLGLPDLLLFVDGYNVTMDPRGVAGAALSDQRRWLVTLLAGVVARHGCAATVVFDGTEPHPGAAPVARGVRVAFTTGDETADERLVALVDDLDPQSPVLVVSSDREVAADCADLGANVASSGVFLAAVGR